MLRSCLMILSVCLLSLPARGGTYYTNKQDWLNALSGTTTVSTDFEDVAPFSFHSPYVAKDVLTQDSFATMNILGGIFIFDFTPGNNEVLVSNASITTVEFDLSSQTDEVVEGFGFDVPGDIVISITSSTSTGERTFFCPTVWQAGDPIPIFADVVVDDVCPMDFLGYIADPGEDLTGIKFQGGDDETMLDNLILSFNPNQARDDIEEIADTVEGLPDQGNPSGNNRVDLANNLLSQINNDAYWNPDGSLTNAGVVVFDLIRQAVNQLDHLDATPEITELINDLLGIASGLAADEIQAAIDRNGNQSLIDDATDQLLFGMQKEAQGKVNPAVNGYQNAWIAARSA